MTDLAAERARRRTWTRPAAAAAAAAALVIGVIAIDVAPSGDGGGRPEFSIGSPAQALMNDLADSAASTSPEGTGTIGRQETSGPDGYQSTAYFLEDGTFIQTYDGGATYVGVRGLYPSLELIRSFPTDDALVPAALDELAAQNTDLARHAGSITTEEARLVEIYYILWDARLDGAQRAALYRYLGALDNAEPAGPTVDALGRPGVTLRITNPTTQATRTIVFDETTGATLETRSTSGTTIIDGQTNVESRETFDSITLVDTAPNTCVTITDYTADPAGRPDFVGPTC